MQLTKGLLAATIVMAASSQAAIIGYGGVLSGSNENPVVATAGTGFATVLYDSTLHTLSVDISFSGLNGLTTAAHIHCCAPLGTNAGVATLVPAFPLFPLGVTSGSVSAILDLTLASSWNPTFVTLHGGTAAGAEAFFAPGFAAGQTYLNIHSVTNPGGEIRLNLTPEPATLALMGASLLALAGLRKRFGASR